MTDVINISVNISYQGQHYAGVTMHDGVGFELADAPCGSARQVVVFEGCSTAPSGVFLDGISCIDICDTAEPLYLQLLPDA